MGHALDPLQLKDAHDLDGKPPYSGTNGAVRGANPLLENAVRAELDAHSKKRGDAEGVPPRPAYDGVPYNKDTEVAGEEFDRLNDFLKPTGKTVTKDHAKRVPEGSYRRNF